VTHIEVGSTALWLMLFLGAYHGINPGMGWLFAVALGMQQQKASAVARSLVPIAIGHAAAIGGVVLAAALLGRALPLAAIRYLVAAVLIALGIRCLVRHRHPRWVRMRVGFRDLVVWSFLMASAHGAGLMVLPVLLGSSTVHASPSYVVSGFSRTHDGPPDQPPPRLRRSAEASAKAEGGHYGRGLTSPLAGLVATGVHTIGYLAMTGAIAWVVYRKFGLALLRTAWFNLDVAWAAALLVTGLVTLVM
jgi:hypothetical protein